MTTTALAVLAFAAWHLFLTGLIWASRAFLIVTSGRAANSFKPDGSDVSPFSARLCRAHANTYENAPYILGLMLLALVTGHGAITDGLALAVVGARVVQSLIHLVSTSAMAVQARFLFFVIQWGIGVYWAWKLFSMSAAA